MTIELTDETGKSRDEILAILSGEALTQSLKDRWNNTPELDENGRVPTGKLPDSILSGLTWKGTIDPSSDTLDSPGSSTSGDFYKVSAAGTLSDADATDYAVGLGDWLISDGSEWSVIEDTTNSATATVEGALKLSNDLDGTSSEPKVKGIKGVPVEGDPSVSGEALIYNLAESKFQFGQVYTRSEINELNQHLSCLTVSAASSTDWAEWLLATSVLLTEGTRVLYDGTEYILNEVPISDTNAPDTSTSWDIYTDVPVGRMICVAAANYGGSTLDASWFLASNGAVTASVVDRTDNSDYLNVEFSGLIPTGYTCEHITYTVSGGENDNIATNYANGPLPLTGDLTIQIHSIDDSAWDDISQAGYDSFEGPYITVMMVLAKEVA